VAAGAFAGTAEVDLPSFGVSHQGIDRSGALGAAADRDAVKKGGDGSYLFRGEIKFGHALVGTAVLDHGGNEFSIFIVENGLAANQVWPSFSASGVGSMAKAVAPQPGRPAASWDRHCQIATRVWPAVWRQWVGKFVVQ
jgi:hypothetical protein